jgi:hypothetical protein
VVNERPLIGRLSSKAPEHIKEAGYRNAGGQRYLAVFINRTEGDEIVE